MRYKMLNLLYSYNILHVLHVVYLILTSILQKWYYYLHLNMAKLRLRERDHTTDLRSQLFQQILGFVLCQARDFSATNQSKHNSEQQQQQK